MRCSENATAPIDIVKSNAGDCQLKCDYTPQYDNTDISAENKGDHILYTFGQTKKLSTFNTEGYRVIDMRLYQPSLHRYEGKNCSAEILITHTNVSKNMTLIVCVPIESAEYAESGMNELISQVAQLANTEGGSTAIRSPGFTLSSLVPLKPFYNYTGLSAFGNCGESIQYIVFGLNNAIRITNKNLNDLTNIITKNEYTVKNNSSGLFYNKKGPDKSTGEIYINCQPTDSSGEIMVDEEGLPTNRSKGYRNRYDKKRGGYLKKILGRDNKKILISIIISIIIVCIIYKLWFSIQNYFNSE